MRKITSLILICFLFVLSSAKKDIDEQGLPYRNLLKNPGAENGLVGATASVPAHLTTIVTPSVIAEGTASFGWTTTGASETLKYTVASVPKNIQGTSCLAKFSYNNAAALASGDFVVRVNGTSGALTDDVDLGNPVLNDWQDVQLAFICPTSGFVEIEFENVLAAVNVRLDSLWLGKDYRLGQTPFDGWKSYDQTEVTVTSAQGGFTVIGANFIPKKLKDGTWVLSGSGQANYTPATISTLTITLSGVSFKSGITQEAGMSLGGSATNQTLRGGYATGGNIQIQVSSTGTTSQVYWSFADLELESKPTWATDELPSPTVTLETQGWYFEGRITSTSGNEALPVTDSDYFVPANTLLQLDNTSTKNKGTCYMACQGETSAGTTCSGAEVFGVSCIMPYAGKWEFCASGSVEMIFDSTGDELQNTFKLSHTQVDDSSVELADGVYKSRMGARQDGGTTNIRSVHNFDNCATFDMVAGQNQVVLKTAVASSTNPLSNTLFVDGSGGVGGLGDRDLFFKVNPSTQNFPQAVALPKADWQRRNLSSDIVNTNVTDIPSLRFVNLNVGSLYKSCYNARFQISGNSASELGQLNAMHNGVTLAVLEFRDDQGPIETRRQSSGTCFNFQATATTLTFDHVVNGTVTLISGAGATFATLEELPWHNPETTKWTP